MHAASSDHLFFVYTIVYPIRNFLHGIRSFSLSSSQPLGERRWSWEHTRCQVLQLKFFFFFFFVVVAFIQLLFTLFSIFHIQFCMDFKYTLRALSSLLVFAPDYIAKHLWFYSSIALITLHVDVRTIKYDECEWFLNTFNIF